MTTGAFSSFVLDALFGLFLLYLVLSLSASAVQEWLASVLSLRSANLRVGVERLFGRTYAQEVYRHPLVRRMAKPGKDPSYLRPDTLASALLDVITRDDDGKLAVSARDGAAALVERIPEESPLYTSLGAIAERGGGSVDDVRGGLADWIDEGMDRISGWYARRAKLNIVVIAIVLTVAANASTVHVVSDLGGGSTQLAPLVQIAAGVVSDEGPGIVDAVGLSDFPIGWEGVGHSVGDWVQRVVGWLITVAAVSLGAPFWFDLLGKVANLRGAGRKSKG